MLGSVANVVVNFIFTPDSNHLDIDEFFIASILFIPITELNRFIDKQLERKIKWLEYPKKRIATHLLILTLCLLISLNILGNAYMFIFENGFFTLKETVIINLVSLGVTILLTFVNWAVHFYFRWIGAENIAFENASLVKDLRKIITQPILTTEIQKGPKKINIVLKNIHYAKIDYGAVRIYCNDGESGFFTGSLSQLEALLPNYLFFRITRDAIIHREAIKSISSSTFGKIQLIVKEKNNTHTTYNVSRPKASTFRKWYYSNPA